MEEGAAIDTELRALRFGCTYAPYVTALVRASEFYFFVCLVLFLLVKFRRGRVLRMRHNTSPPLTFPV